MTKQEYLELSRGDLCVIDNVDDKDHERLVKVRYIEDGYIVVKACDKCPFENDNACGATFRIMNRHSLRIVLKAVKESE